MAKEEKQILSVTNVESTVITQEHVSRARQIRETPTGRGHSRAPPERQTVGKCKIGSATEDSTIFVNC